MSLVLLSSSPSVAASDDEARAEALFEDAKRAMTEGRLEEACPKLRESQRLDPSGGTALLLALCLERQGKLASAWVAFSDALARARRDGAPDREALATAHLAALGARIPRVLLEIEPGASALPGVALARDGAPVPRDEWGAPWPVDPGRHTLRLSAPGRPTTEAELDVANDGATYRVRLSLAPAPEAPPPRDEAQTTPRRGSATPVAAWVLGGAAVASSLVGGYFGLSARSKMSEVRTLCPSSPCASAEAEALRDDARRRARVSTAAFALGVGLAAGAVWVGVRGDRATAGVALGGAF